MEGVINGTRGAEGLSEHLVVALRGRERLVARSEEENIICT